MKTQAQLGTPPDVSCVQEMNDINKVNEYLNPSGWVLLGILYTRNVEQDGSYRDAATYIIGLPRGK